MKIDSASSNLERPQKSTRKTRRADFLIGITELNAAPNLVGDEVAKSDRWIWNNSQDSGVLEKYESQWTYNTVYGKVKANSLK